MSGVEAIFGVVTGGAGLLSLGVELGQSAAKLRRLYHAVKDAPKTIVLLVFDLETMAMALSELEKTRQRDSSTRTILERCIMRCRQSTAEVKQLVDKMERCIAKHSRLRGKLYTAFKERDVKELLDDLERAKSTLEFAYTMYHSEEQMERHDKHHNMLSLQSRRSDDILQQLMLLSQSFMPREQRQLAIADEEAAETCPMPVIAREMGITVARTDNARHDQTRHCQPPRRRVKSEHTKNQRRIRFRLPVWLCSKIWDLTINSSHCGWSMHLSTYRAVSKYSAIFLCCFKGDIEGVQRLIQNGEASLLDTAVWDFDGQELHTLIELSTHFGQRALCQYLLQQTPWPDQAKVLSRALSCYRGPREEPDEHMYRLFFDTPGFDADFEGDDREHWLSRCTNWECLEFVLRSQFPHFFTLSADEKFALVIHKGMRDIETPTDFAKLIGLSRSDQRLATLRCSNGTTVLHYVAKRLRDIVFGRVLAWPEPSERPYRISKRESLQDWLSFGASLLKDGADPCSIAYPECTDRGNAPASPLLEMLGLWNFKWQFKPSHEARTRIMVLIERIRIWAEMLQQAGIDLYQYGASESEIWQSLKPFYLPSNPGPKAEGFAETMIVEQLVYGSTPADWGVLLCPFWTIHVYKLRRLPGDFVGERLLPEVIPWSPMREEDGEGYWDIVKSTTMTSTSTDLRNLAYPSIPNFVQLLHVLDEGRVASRPFCSEGKLRTADAASDISDGLG
ncbi:hypothetical protein EDD36DRAFT_485823 [Exophiala viscosa]|uniref:Azaphilone pigments biosynthesis cluster protein L N-terminal domain-containing protein n=1 Tax=Exophiala viscosa TaxID=2486360 RepID=A0AAN6IFE4_9EURO|nr:hypothetical protein EDD36DRAFT_485823 [Exophiala viscosa]